MSTIWRQSDSALAQTRLISERPILIGVSKGQGLGAVEEAISAGLTHFGENRVQEAEEKYPALKAQHPNLTLHLIGPLQSNKVKEAVALFDVIQTIDRPKIAEAVKAECDKQAKAIPCMIQVNIGEEPQKAGMASKETGRFVRFCREEVGLPITGLMCIPPAGEPPAPYFALLYKMSMELGLPHRSMGMTGDYETAIRMGATHIRIGTGLFGKRG